MGVEFVLSSRFIVGVIVGILAYMLWMRKRGSASA